MYFLDGFLCWFQAGTTVWEQYLGDALPWVTFRLQIRVLNH